MKRLQVMITKELDAPLDPKVRSEGLQAALTCQYVREDLKPLAPAEADPVSRVVPLDDLERDTADNLVY